MDPILPLLTAFVAVAYTVQTATGFGAGIVLLTLGAQFMPIPALLPLLVPLSMVQTSVVSFRNRGDIDWGYLLRWVFPIMGAGMLVSFWTLGNFDAPWLKPAFAIMILVLAISELYRLFVDSQPTATPRAGLSPLGAGLALAGAGVVHGIYACGGPLLVYATGRRGFDKARFRATITFVWVVLNATLCVNYAIVGRFEPGIQWTLLALLPGLPVGMLLGDWLHRQVDERRFKLAVYVLLVLAALALLIR